MKQFFLLLLSFISLISLGQSADRDSSLTASPKDKVFQVVEHMPEFPGGDDGLIKFIQNNIVYPDYAREHDIQGRVVVTFIVDVDGSLTDISIKQSVHPLLDAEALRVVRLMPHFKPGTQQGKVVRTAFNLPLSFKLAPAEPEKKKKGKKK